MFRNIIKSFKYLIIIAGVIIMLPVVLYSALQFPEVQTFIVKRITSHLSNEIKTTISVGKFEYRFFNKIIINDLLIRDQNRDTLLFSQIFTAGIRRIDFRNKNYRLGRVVLFKPVINLITDSTGTMNLTWYLDMLKNQPDTIKKKSQGKIMIDEVDVSNARFSRIKHSDNQTNNKTKIDFNNIQITELNGIIEDIKIINDTTSFDIYNLNFKEAGGFYLKRLNSSLTLARGSFLLNSTLINCDSSIINISRFGLYTDTSSLRKSFIQGARLDVLFDKSLINTSDVQYFISFTEGINESVWMSGKVTGTISELRGRNIVFNYRENTYIDCDFDFSGLPDIDNAFMHIGVNNLTTNATDLEKIRIQGKRPPGIPAVLFKLGNITFDGSFTGFTTDFVTYGMIRTSYGNIRTDISLRPEESDKYRIKGLLTGTGIDIGELSGNNELFGDLSIQTNVDGYALSLKKFDVKLSGRIDSIEINRYIYRNVSLNGFFTEKAWDGSVNINDKNLKLDFLGLFNFSDKLPVFDFTLNLAKANLFNLNFDKLDKTSSLSMLLTANFKGNSIDNLDGEIKLLNSIITRNNKNLELYDLSIRAFTENNRPVLRLRTDFVDADITGYYYFSEFRSLIKSTMSSLMPSRFPDQKQQSGLKKNNFTFSINFKNTDEINSFFRTGISLAEKSYLKGSVMPDILMSIEGKSKLFTIKNNSFSNFFLDANIRNSELSVDLKSSSLSLLKQSELKDLFVKLRTRPDNFSFSIDWDNKSKEINKGNFIARGKFENDPTKSKHAVLRIDIDSTDIYARNNQWKVSQSTLTVDSTSLNINRLFIKNNENYYLVDGIVSENPADTLNLQFKGIDLNPLNYVLIKSNPDNPDPFSLQLKGILNGSILLTDVYKNLLLETNLLINDLSLLGSEFGNISIKSGLDIGEKVLNIKAFNNILGAKTLDIVGNYNPAQKKLDLTIATSKLTINALNPLLKIFASGISGFASGKVNLTAESGTVLLKGSLLAENASMKVDYLQTRYNLNDSIRFDKNGIKFNNVRLTDERGNRSTLNGSVNHKNFKDFRADLIINTTESLVLNTKPKDNELFYGTAYASGVTTIRSGPNSLTFDISAKTGKNTKFYMPLNSGLSVSEYSFITFKDNKTTPEDDTVKTGIKSILPAVKTGMDIDFDLEVTPEAEVQLIFDSKVGDVLKGHGSGNLNIKLDKNGDFKMSGDYIIEDGDYLFTLGNIINKSFSMENGGRIIFNGELEKAELEIKAIYKLRASLYEILKDERFKERIPVECQLNLTGNLFNPVIALNIYLPNADEQTRAYLQNAISTEEELSRQFLYLLVMNSFYSDQSSYGSSTSSTSSTSAMAVTTTEMISNQLSNWISQISNDFDLGFVYRPGTSSINPQEVQVALSTQILNDKVSINGNFDVRGTGTTASNTDQITGDFDAEVKITEKFRFKVFNRFNDIYSGKGPYTQGVGILYKQDFNKLSDLFRKKVKSEMKKEEEPEIKLSND